MNDEDMYGQIEPQSLIQPSPPTEPTNFLKDYLMRKMLEKQNTADLEEAQRQARESSAMTDIAEAGTRGLQAVVGGTPTANFQGSRERDKQILNDYLQQKALEKQYEAERFNAAKELADMQAQEAKLNIRKPEGKSVELIEDPTRKGGYLRKVTLRDAKGDPISSYTERATEEEYKRQQDAQDAAFKREQLAQQKLISEENLAQRKEKVAIEQVNKIQDKFDKNNIPSVEAGLAGVEALLKKYPTGKIPGFGKAESLVTIPLITPDEWDLNRQTVEALAAPIRKMNYGSAQSKQETENFLKQLGTGKGMGEAVVRQGIESIRKLIDENKKAIFQRDPEAAKTYMENRPAAETLVKPSLDLSKVNSNLPPTGVKKVVGKKYSKSANKTRFEYSDGSVEVVDGRK